MNGCFYAIDRYSDYGFWLRTYNKTYHSIDEDNQTGCSYHLGSRSVIVLLTITEAIRLIGNVVKCVLECLAKIVLYIPAKWCEKSDEDREIPSIAARYPSFTPQPWPTRQFHALKPSRSAKLCLRLIVGICANAAHIIPFPGEAYEINSMLLREREESRRSVLAAMGELDSAAES